MSPLTRSSLGNLEKFSFNLGGRLVEKQIMEDWFSTSNEVAIQRGFNPELVSCLIEERIFEDHENLVENLLNWTRDSHNKLMFIERIEKYALFKNPQVRCPPPRVAE